MLDYGSWVSALAHDEVLDIFANYRSDSVAFEEAFAERWQITLTSKALYDALREPVG